MDAQSYIEEIRFRLTGDVLECELEDAQFEKVLNSALREIQRYISTTEIITINYSKCIDLSDINVTNGKKINVNSVSRVYRAESYTSDSESDSYTDPMQVAQWQLLSGAGNLAGFQDYAYNYMAWNTLSQIRNTTSTDLTFRFDRASNKLYINCSTNVPGKITLEYIPRYNDVSEITSDYWIDILMRMAIAIAKITLGRIRSRYTQNNALWSNDGQDILQEGLSEYSEIQQHLQTNTQLVYPID